MKVILFLCLALIATFHTASAISRAEIISLLQQDYTIDRVLDLFEALRTQESQDLTDLDAAYAVEEPQLAAEIVRTQGLLDAKTAECNGIEATLNGQIAERQRLNDNIRSSEETITSNNDKVSQLEDARCAANILFIGRMAQNQEAAHFLGYLRERVQAPDFADYLNDNPAAFLQMKQTFASKKTDDILTMVAQHHLLSLLQQGYEGEGDANLDATFNARARTDAEVGTGHLDNDRGALNRQVIDNREVGTGEYVTQLLGFIDELLAAFASSTAALQAAEQASIQALIDYRNRIEDENYVLQRYIEATQYRVGELNGIIDNNTRALADCRAEIPPLEEGRNEAQANYDTYVANYNSRRANLVNTIDLLGRVIEIYTQEVVNVAGTTYRERTEDYLGDQTFDQTGGFTARGSAEAIATYSG